MAEPQSPAEIMRAHLDTFATSDALRDDLAESRRACQTYRLIAQCAIHELHALTLKVDAQQARIREMREERNRIARDVFGRVE